MLETIEMHTGGEPVRIVIGGFPDVAGGTILEKRRYVADNLDHLRRLLMLEPRGHYDMYGVLPVAPDHPDADLAVLFMHNEGYSTMCGHATIALGRYAVDNGIVAATEPETVVRLQVPSGLVEITVDVRDGLTGGARYTSVPSFVSHSQLAVDPPGHPPLRVDIGYGGAFYALASATDLGWQLNERSATEIKDVGTAITAAVNETVDIRHPDHDDLGFLYGTILTDGVEDGPSTNVCVFADAQVDRSPTGSGVQARLARAYAAGDVTVGETRRYRSITGSEFSGRVVSETMVDTTAAVVVEVGGHAFYTGESKFRIEDGDDMTGFVVN